MEGNLATQDALSEEHNTLLRAVPCRAVVARF